MPLAASAAAYPMGQGTSSLEATKGQDLVLPQGQDQRALHPRDAQGGAQGAGHPDGVLTSTGSHELADRYATRLSPLCLTLTDRAAVELCMPLHIKVHNGSTLKAESQVVWTYANSRPAWTTTECTQR